MNSFLSQIKNSNDSSKSSSILVINIFKIQLSISMFLGTSFAKFSSIQNIFDQKTQNLQLLSTYAFIVHVLILLFMFLQIMFPQNLILKSPSIYKSTTFVINFYRNCCLIPILYLTFQTIDSSSDSFSIFLFFSNMMIAMLFSYFQDVCCKTLRFRFKNYYQKITSTYHELVVVIIVIGLNCLYSHTYGAMLLLAKSVYTVVRLHSTFEQPVVQQFHIFYNLHQVNICALIILTDFASLKLNDNFALFIFYLVTSYFVVRNVTESLSSSIYLGMLTALNQAQDLNAIQSQQQLLALNVNKIRTMGMILLQKQRYEQNDHQQRQSDKFNYKWWRYYNRDVINHKVNCVNINCLCKKQTTKPSQTQQVFLVEIITKIQQLTHSFSKNIKLTIMNIYQYIQLSKKPLKAYYQLMKIKSQSQSSARNKTSQLQIQLNQLTLQTRICFDRLFFKHQVKNQKLELSKVIEFEQLLNQCQSELKQIVKQTIKFYSIFNLNHYNKVKLSKIKSQSNSLNQLKQSFDLKLSHILNNYSSNIKLIILIHFFYNYIHVYQNKQSELHKITQSQLFKKRYLDKNQINVFNPENGTILIDLVQEKGKIMNLTKNMCTLFGHTKQSMINFNINQFMPRLFGHNHARFLNNFVQKGAINLLAYNAKSVFGKNKKKFIFPINVSLKVQYLQNNFFGSSGLIRKIQSSSQFILVDKYGKIEEITETIYRKLFGSALQQECHKISRLHINKIIPSFNFNFQDKESEKGKYQRLYEGIILFTQDSNYLLQKFRFAKQINRQSNKSNLANHKPIKSILKSKTPFPNIGSLTNKSELQTLKQNTPDFKSRLNDLSQSATNSRTKTTITLSLQQQRLNLAEIMKYFITQIDFSYLSGLKITYKVTPVVTAQFNANLVEIVSAKSFTAQNYFCQALIDQLQQIIEVFNFNQQEHSLVFSHIEELKSQLAAKSLSTFQQKTLHSSNNSSNYNNLIAAIAPRQMKSKQQKFFDDIKSISFKSDKQKKFSQVNLDLLQNTANGNQSSTDTLQAESRKHLLVSSFSNDIMILDSRYSTVAGFIISFLMIMLIIMSVFGVVYMKLLSHSWKTSHFIQQIKQLIEYRNSLQQIQLFESLNNPYKLQSKFIQQKSYQLTDIFKRKLQNIYDSVIEVNAFDQFYTHSLTLINTKSQVSQDLSVILLLKQLIWSFEQQSTHNTIFLRQNYDSFSLQLRNMQLKINQFLEYKQQRLHLVILVINILYFGLLFLLGIGVIPVLIHLKNEQKQLTQLLEYISFKQLNKSLHKLTSMLHYIDHIDNIRNFTYMKNEFVQSVMKMTRQKSEQIQTGNSTSSLILAQQQTSTSSTSRKCLLVLLLITLLSLLPVYILVIVSEVSIQFESTIGLHKQLYELQNKPAYLLNTYLKNVNNYLSNDKYLQFSNQLFKKMQRDYFNTIAMLSTPSAQNSQIYDQIKQLMSQPLCNIVQCLDDNVNNQYNKSTIDYLVYQFKNKFQFLSPQNNHAISLVVNNNFNNNNNNSNTLSSTSTTSQIHELWLTQNNIENILMSIQTILTISQKINPYIYTHYKHHLKSNLTISLVINILLIILNIFILVGIKSLTFCYFTKIIKQSMSIFKHFDIETLSQNTYLTSYFNNKIKENK